MLCLSTLAEHGRNVTRDPRASLVIGEPDVTGDPLDSGRVTLAGHLEQPQDEELVTAQAAYKQASPASGLYGGFGDFTYYVLRIERVRWVGGYGRMDSTDAAAYHAAAPDPVAPGAAYAIQHLNDDHADALLLMAQKLGGHPDATEARCVRIDRYGLDLRVTTPRGIAETRIGFAEPAGAPGGLRAATRPRSSCGARPAPKLCGECRRSTPRPSPSTARSSARACSTRPRRSCWSPATGRSRSARWASARAWRATRSTATSPRATT